MSDTVDVRIDCVDVRIDCDKSCVMVMSLRDIDEPDVMSKSDLIADLLVPEIHKLMALSVAELSARRLSKMH